MMQRRTWAKLILTAIVILMYAYFTFWAAPRYEKISEGAKLLDTSPMFSSEELKTYRSSLPDRTAEAYDRLMLPDMVFPLLYGSLLMLSGRRTGRCLLISTSAAVISDYIENVMIRGFLSGGPWITSRIGLLPVITCIKFGAILTAIVCIIVSYRHRDA